MKIFLAASLALVVYSGAAVARPLPANVCAEVRAAVAAYGIEGAIQEALRRGYTMAQIRHARRVCHV